MFASHLHFVTRAAEPRTPRRRVERAIEDGQALTIRLAPGTEPALDRLAELDGRVLSAGPRLVAEIGGRPIAALALADATTVADPMRPSAPFVELLRVRARQLGAVA
jgi:hypothetical protein